MSLLWRTAVTSEHQEGALQRLRGMPDLIDGDAAKSLLGEHGIHVHKISPSMFEDSTSPTDYDTRVHIPAHQELHTGQTHLWRPALEHYIQHGSDAPSPTKEDEEDNHPHVHIQQGKTWIGEGHHRILSDRMTLGQGIHSLHRDFDEENKHDPEYQEYLKNMDFDGDEWV